MTKNDKAGEIIFVGGAPRSGTTLLQKMLNCHSMIWGGPEFDNAPAFVELREKLRQSVDSGRIDQFCDFGDVDRVIAACMLSLIGSRAFEQGYCYVSEKTPWNVLVFEQLMEIFPAARFINVVRDPRAVVSSMLDVGERARNTGVESSPYTKSVALACEVIKRSYLAIENVTNKCDGRMIMVRYEDFVAHPDIETRKVCDFLGIAWEEAMCQPHTREHDMDVPAQQSGSPYMNPSTFKSAPDPARINAWSSKLTSNQIAKIEILLGHAASRYGYELNSSPRFATMVARVQILGDKLFFNSLEAVWKLARYTERSIRQKRNAGIPDRW